MSYLEDERKRLISLRDQLFDDTGNGLFMKIPREFVLLNSEKNLFISIRKDALDYFERNQITWWNDRGNGLTGHLLSSQIACINHLFFLRNSKEMASAVLRGLHYGIREAKLVDDGFVEFEVIGSKNYLGEKSHQRGANSTSIDAVMVGKKRDGSQILVMIEWKYTEKYRSTDKYIPARANIYDRLVMDPDSPIQVAEPRELYFEPYYQLMRQTLLGWQMVKNHEYGCNEFVHVHVIPDENSELNATITSPYLAGASMSDAWRKTLKKPDRYLVISPRSFLQPVANFEEAQSSVSYLSKRYWNEG